MIRSVPRRVREAGRSFVARNQPLVRVGRRVGQRDERRRVLQDSADRKSTHLTHPGVVVAGEEVLVVLPEGHVHVHPTSCSKTELEAFLGEIYNRPFPPNRPPYEFILIEEYEDGKSALLCRSHHVIADGMAFVGMIMNGVDPIKADQTESNLQKKIAKLKISKWDIVRRLPFIPWYWVKPLIQPNDHNLLHGPPLSGKRSMACGDPIPLDQVKYVKNQLKCTVNDLLMVCLAKIAT